MNFLGKVRKVKGQEVEIAKKRRPLASFKNKLKKSKRDFRKAIAGSKEGVPALIAEIKRASPSKGIITKDFDVKEIAKLYEKYASAVSVLTDKQFFKGKLEYLKIASNNSKLPVLRKDFIIDEYQIYESRLYKADAILLISNLLPKEKINGFIKIANSLGMDCLVEVECAAALKKILDTKASIIGINNRDLHSLKVNKTNTSKLVKLIPKEKRSKLIVVAESGVENRLDVEKLKGKVDSVLVGSSMMESKNRTAKLKELSGKPLVKICGITSKKDAADAVKLGADFLGFNFYRGSPRHINPKKAREIILSLPKNVSTVGVFVNAENPNAVNCIARYCKLDFAQLHGNESNAYCEKITKPAIKVFRVKNRKSLREINKYKTPFILLDAFVKGIYGGTGKRIDYNLIRGREIKNKLVFLSGGVNSRNVKSALKLKPFAVDVCSGVEETPGRKSYAKMNALFKEVYG